MKSHHDTGIELVAASSSDARLISSLLDEYLRELSQHRDVPIGATDSANYRYLGAYWSEPGRHAFLIKQGSLEVGFAFVRDPTSTRAAVHELAEFYINPESRRLGIGRHAALAIWNRFPGEWELQVHSRNAGAVQFWTSCAEQAQGIPPEIREVQAEDGQRLQLNFSVGHAA